MTQPGEQPIRERSVWRYRGPGAGRGILHWVTSTEAGEVTTWSQPFASEEIGGHSYLGSAQDFRRDFTPVSPL